MTDDSDLAELLKDRNDRHAAPTAYLIRENYRAARADTFSYERFMRLCAAFGETEIELAARIGMSPDALTRRRNRGGFGNQGCFAECILLTQFERFIEWHHTGAERPNELFLAPKSK